MNDFLNTLPWRLASIAALIVGIVVVATDSADAWDGIERAGVAFAVFYIIGILAKALLQVGTLPAGESLSKSREALTDAHSALRHPSSALDVSGLADGSANAVDGTTNI